MAGFIQPAAAFKVTDAPPRKDYGEGILSALSAIVGAAPAGLAGIFSGGDPGAVQAVQDAFTYKPKTQEGQRGLEDISSVMEVLGKPAQWIGQKAFEGSGHNPLVGAAAETFLDPLNFLGGWGALRGAKGLRGMDLTRALESAPTAGTPAAQRGVFRPLSRLDMSKAQRDTIDDFTDSDIPIGEMHAREIYHETGLTPAPGTGATTSLNQWIDPAGATFSDQALEAAWRGDTKPIPLQSAMNYPGVDDLPELQNYYLQFLNEVPGGSADIQVPHAGKSGVIRIGQPEGPPSYAELASSEQGLSLIHELTHGLQFPAGVDYGSSIKHASQQYPAKNLEEIIAALDPDSYLGFMAERSLGGNVPDALLQGFGDLFAGGRSPAQAVGVLRSGLASNLSPELMKELVGLADTRTYMRSPGEYMARWAEDMARADLDNKGAFGYDLSGPFAFPPYGGVAFEEASGIDPAFWARLLDEELAARLRQEKK